MTEYRYDAEGRRTVSILPDGRQTRTAYDAGVTLLETVFASDATACTTSDTSYVTPAAGRS